MQTYYYQKCFTICLIWSLLVVSWAGSANGKEYLGRLVGMPVDSTPVSESLNCSPTFNCDSAHPAIYVGCMGRNNGIRAGYTGLVLPGTCVSSYFVYNLDGIVLAATAPVNVGKSLSMRLAGSYLVAMRE